MEISRILPRPGPVWGRYPMRKTGGNPSPWRPLRIATLARTPYAQARRTAKKVSDTAGVSREAWRTMNEADRAASLLSLRARLRHEGLTADSVAQALALVAACAMVTLGQAPRETQLLAAAVLLDQRMAEMSTGEGKTLALALAAAVGALAGMPVHVVTANDYLAGRDAATLQPFFAALGLSVVALHAARQEGERRAAYRHDVVYSTARDLAFDFLRDQLGEATRRRMGDPSPGGVAPDRQPPLMRGLCMALLDEADSILLDEAEVPLILSRSAPHAARRAFLWQALALARQLEPARDFTFDVSERSASLTPAGDARCAELVADLGGPWQRSRYRREAVTLALTGLHACQRNAHYVVRDGAIELLDEVTGRIAAGRVWSRGLHTVVALKEGLKPPAENDTAAQITFQHFFQRYWRLAGLSGTLYEARRELQAVTGASVVRIPLHVPSLQVALPLRLFDDAEARWDAVCKRVAELHLSGRPVLIGTDSVADSESLAQHLQRAGIAHRVLNALNDGQEAAIVAEAGRAGQVTVATRMAGRGTDIQLDAQARAAGGLHVLSCQHNPSIRLDRQLAGRAARHGDPGSMETWLLWNSSALLSEALWYKSTLWKICRKTLRSTRFASLIRAMAQGREEHRRALLRRELLRQGSEWENRLSFTGPPS